MRIHLISDLHVEFYEEKKHFQMVLDSIPNKDVDVLVLAGDLGVGFKKRIKPAIKQLCDRFPHVVYVLGNHDYWYSTIEERHAQLLNLDSKIDNFHFLEKSAVEIDGQRFIGGTLWYPSEALGRPANWCDHVRIDIAKPSILTYYDITKEHDITKEYLKKNVKPEDIVVTHHLPSYKCVSDRYQGDPLSCYFASNCDDIMLLCEPKIWFFGHSHFTMNLKIFNTELFSNAFGYPGEIICAYDPNFVIDTEQVRNVE